MTRRAYQSDLQNLVPAPADLPDDVSYVPKCSQCGGPGHLCELPDSTCRFKVAAREFSEGAVDDEPLGVALRALAKLLRETEDKAWERLSEARSKRIDLLEEVLCAALSPLVNSAGVFSVLAGLKSGTSIGPEGGNEIRKWEAECRLVHARILSVVQANR